MSDVITMIFGSSVRRKKAIKILADLTELSSNADDDDWETLNQILNMKREALRLLAMNAGEEELNSGNRSPRFNCI